MRTKAAECSSAGAVDAIAALRERIGRIESGLTDDKSAGVFATGWAPIDADLPDGGLRRGAIHEWIGWKSSRGWAPPLLVMAHLTHAALEQSGDDRCAVWIGRNIWPYGSALVADNPHEALRRCLLIDPAREADRVWAIELALRSSAVAAVAADGSRLTHKATRRLQLAAESGDAIGLLARPPNDIDSLSAATTRWRIAPALSDQFAPRWTVELVRCKGAQPKQRDRRWSVELSRAGRLVVPSNLADRSDATANRATKNQRDHALAPRRSA